MLSGLITVSTAEKNEVNSLSTTLLFSQPEIIEKEKYVKIQISESNSNLWEADKPLLPVVSKVFEFPFGTKIDNVEVTFSDPITKKISKPVEPTPKTFSINSINKNVESNKEISYENLDIYPEKQFSYSLASGKNKDKHVVICALSLYPVQYNVKDNTIAYAQNADITIKYTPPKNPIKFADEYDLLILTPDEFVSTLQRFIDHKEQRDIKTKIVTLDEIPSQGVDTQESIKYFIKDAIENWGIDYVILVGSSVLGQAKFPFRYAWIGDAYEDFFPSDLYYADIYDSNGDFSDWDYDEDGKYAEYPDDMIDVDIVPDVLIGKIPCDNIFELSAYIDKVIWYDEHNLMTKKIVLVGGDTIPGDEEGIYEGEYANTKVLDKLPGYTDKKLWASQWRVTKLNIATNYNTLPDFIDFSGHGSYKSWATHPPEDSNLWVPTPTSVSEEGGWRYEDFDIYNVKNPKKYPIVFSNACSNNKYHKLKDCLGWKTLRHPNGGGVIYFGSSGIASASWGTDITQRLFGWMELHGFEELYNTKNLGEVWSNCVKDYFSTFEGSFNKKDYKTMLEFSMFGDPTLYAQDGDDPKIKQEKNDFSNILNQIIYNFPILAQIFYNTFLAKVR